MKLVYVPTLAVDNKIGILAARTGDSLRVDHERLMRKMLTNFLQNQSTFCFQAEATVLPLF